MIAFAYNGDEFLIAIRKERERMASQRPPSMRHEQERARSSPSSMETTEPAPSPQGADLGNAPIPTAAGGSDVEEARR